MAFIIKQGDTSPVLEAVLKQPNGAAVDLTGASVDYHMRPSGKSAAVVDQQANIEDAAAGVVRYYWKADDTAQRGAFEAEFEVTYPDGRIETFPNDGYIEISITEQIA